MNDSIIVVENLGKKYRIKHQAERQRYVALRDVLADKTKGAARRIWSLVRSQKSPARGLSPRVSVEEDFWALKDVSFEVKRGEVLGIIGRNGAGKTTLLKILSRITEPTEGRVHLRGRVASLLEVGTGFHPELTGHENILLNGAILGMSRVEIKARFDEIVAFAEIEKFLDTPVKRYSSGMYVRLAFAVAAHLEPEILLVDEVLAVGDAQFQTKCLGKMQEVAGLGRTVLFVSHNLAAVSSLTTRCIVLGGGRISFDGKTADAVAAYSASSHAFAGASGVSISSKGAHSQIQKVRLLDDRGATVRSAAAGAPLSVEVVLATDGAPGLSLELFLNDALRRRVGMMSLHQFHGLLLPRESGTYRVRLVLDPLNLASGEYSLDAATSMVNSNWDHFVEEAATFEIPFSNLGGRPWDLKQVLGYGVLGIALSSPPDIAKLGNAKTPACVEGGRGAPRVDLE